MLSDRPPRQYALTLAAHCLGQSAIQLTPCDVGDTGDHISADVVARVTNNVYRTVSVGDVEVRKTGACNSPTVNVCIKENMTDFVRDWHKVKTNESNGRK